MVIFSAISFLKSQLNSYLKFQLGEDHSNPVSHDSTPVANTADKVIMTLVNVEEERFGRIQSPQNRFN